MEPFLMREYTNVNHEINDQNLYYIDCGRKNLAKCAVGSVRRIPTANSPKNIWRPHSTACSSHTLKRHIYLG